MYPQSTIFPHILDILYYKTLCCSVHPVLLAGPEQAGDPPHTAGPGHSAHRGQMPGEEINWRSVIMSTDEFNSLPQLITVSLGLLDIHTGKVL